MQGTPAPVPIPIHMPQQPFPAAPQLPHGMPPGAFTMLSSCLAIVVNTGKVNFECNKPPVLLHHYTSHPCWILRSCSVIHSFVFRARRLGITRATSHSSSHGPCVPRAPTPRALPSATSPTSTWWLPCKLETANGCARHGCAQTSRPCYDCAETAT
jgi:hypothetical protein